MEKRTELWVNHKLLQIQSRRCDLAARKSVLEDHYAGLCSLVDGFYSRMEFESCLRGDAAGHSSAANSDVFKKYVEENISVFTLKSSDRTERDSDASAKFESPVEL